MQGQKNLMELLVNVEATLHEMFAVMQDSTKKREHLKLTLHLKILKKEETKSSVSEREM